MEALPTSSPALALLAPVLTLASIQAVDASGYLKLDSIDGESTDPKHENWIDIDTFSWGVTCETDPTSGVAAPKTIDLVFAKYIDKASPHLFLKACTGQQLDSEVTLVFNSPERNNGEDYIKVTFYKVEILNYKAAGAQGEAIPTESVSLSFHKVTFEYHPADGSEAVVETRDFDNPG